MMSDWLVIQNQRIALKNELQTLGTEMEGYLKELGYAVQDAQVSRAQGCAGATGAGGDK